MYVAPLNTLLRRWCVCWHSMTGLRRNIGLDLNLHLRGGDGDSGEDEGVQIFRTVNGYDLEPMPTFSLRTPDQEEGVDYGYIFAVRTYAAG